MAATHEVHQAARNQILHQCGEGIDTWIVGRQPVAHLEENGNVSRRAQSFEKDNSRRSIPVAGLFLQSTHLQRSSHTQSFRIRGLCVAHQTGDRGEGGREVLARHQGHDGRSMKSALPLDGLYIWGCNGTVHHSRSGTKNIP